MPTSPQTFLHTALALTLSAYPPLVLTPAATLTRVLTFVHTLVHERTRTYLQCTHVFKKSISARGQRRNQHRHLIGHKIVGMC